MQLNFENLKLFHRLCRASVRTMGRTIRRRKEQFTQEKFKNTKGKFTEIQWKGAGATPYSRHADGRAVLRSPSENI